MLVRAYDQLQVFKLKMTNMSDEEKAAQEAKAEETEVESKATDDETAEEESKVEEPDEESKQLETELKREREAREKAEKALAEGRYKRAESKRQEVVEEEESESDEDDDKPMTRKEQQADMDRRESTIRKEVLNSEALRLADSMSTNDTEKQLILEKWKSHSFPSHISLEEQIESCYAMAFRKRIIGQRNEALRALKGKEGVQTNSATTHHDAPSGSAPKIATGDAAELARVGYVFNSTAKRYEKKLSNGKLLVKKDLKTPAQMV